ncbi:hypothetical protein NIES4072_72910 [Nostoc commune NIES-4072]|uniref:Uncharacterized protein n=1 Tax=Nostoc commune NIES-4072 TaxID=2005467 RepID=A0A2R5FZV7_NOSCO|nr:hypothetical protein [Nostoc commune]BBD70925.1 hypothetical protein NIES4070_73360 [Nostoc commune HK-02]GBG23579.1 hypothetical protein NIES4072_72910 [Nostoc commune NIES-4072]
MTKLDITLLSFPTSCDRSEVHPEEKFLKGRLQANFGGLYSQAEIKDW